MAGSITPPPAGPQTPARPHATHKDELQRPYVAGEATSASEKEKDAKEWRLIVAIGIGLAAFFGYVKLWPWLQSALYRPSPIRDVLLPPSPSPIWVIAGVGVGIFWLLFIAAPAALLLTSGLWAATIAAGNRRAHKGHEGNVRPGQEWAGEQFYTWPILTAAAAVILAAAGALMRWTWPAMSSLTMVLLLIALFATCIWAYVQLVVWARGRALITRQINQITALTAPTLGWNELRAGRIKAIERVYPRGEKPYPKTIHAYYTQHPRSVGVGDIDEVGQVLTSITGHTYACTNEMLTKTLVFTDMVITEEENTQSDAEAVLIPLVLSWFDASARIAHLKVEDAPAPDLINPAKPNANTPNQDTTTDPDISIEPADKAEDNGEAFTEADEMAARISAFTVEFTRSIKTGSAVRRSAIESDVTSTLGGSWTAEWSLVSGRVKFVRSPGLPNMVDPPLEFPVVNRKAIRQLYKQAKIPFARDAHGYDIVWDFKQSPHFLVAGPTSTGKTSLLMTVATQCARRGFNVVWIDPKGQDSPGLYALPNFSLVTRGFDDDGMVGHIAALRFLADTMRERYAAVKLNPNRADDFDPIVVITDEFSNLVMELMRFYQRFKHPKMDKGKFPTEEDVGTILRTARAVGIHMVIGLQRPDTAFIKGEARDNTSLRVAMGRLKSKDAALMMFNDPVAGTRLQPGIKGRGTVQLPDNSFREIQVFYTPLAPATEEKRAELSDHERHILDVLSDVESFWPRRVVDSVLRYHKPSDPPAYCQIRDSQIVLASDNRHLDPISEEYEPPLIERKPTMDDHGDEDDFGDESHGDTPEESTPPPPEQGSTFAADVDGYADDYMPTIEDEYGHPIPTLAADIEFGDLVDVSVDASGQWKYVYADPWIEDDEGVERVIIPFRNYDDGQDLNDVDVDAQEVYQVRKLHMND